jgi:hypothetical protein
MSAGDAERFIARNTSAPRPGRAVSTPFLDKVSKSIFGSPARDSVEFKITNGSEDERTGPYTCMNCGQPHENVQDVGEYCPECHPNTRGW